MEIRFNKDLNSLGSFFDRALILPGILLIAFGILVIVFPMLLVILVSAFFIGIGLTLLGLARKVKKFERAPEGDYYYISFRDSWF